MRWRNIQQLHTSSITIQDCISPYTADERTRLPVMAAQVNNKSIEKVHECNFRHSLSYKYPQFKPHFDGDSFSGTLYTITMVIKMK